MARYRRRPREIWIEDRYYDRPGPDFYGNNNFTLPDRDVYVEDENLSGTFAPTEFENRDDDYEYRYEAFPESWRFDSDNDYGQYSPNVVNDYGGYGASGYAGPYFGHPYYFRRHEEDIDSWRRRRGMPGRYEAEGRYPRPYDSQYYSRHPESYEMRTSGYGRRYPAPPPPPYPVHRAGAWEQDSRYMRARRRFY